MNFMQALQKRRSRYQLENKLPISEKALTELVGECVRQAPSAFNMQSARVVILLPKQHAHLWKLTADILRPKVSLEQWPATEQKLNSFAAAYGTILFLEDQTVVQRLQQQFPLYAANFPIWAQQANGMLQLAVWTALAEQGIGANLQHYNPLIDARVQSDFQLPEHWQLVAQMPFGTPTAEPAEKTYEPLSERMIIK